MSELSPPDFRWTSFYYPEVFAALIQLKRQAWPEHTEEDPHDPVIQLYRAFGTLAHVQACRLDHAARELYLPTARLRSSVIALARLVDYALAPAAPAEVDLVADVSGALSVAAVVVRGHSVFATAGSADTAVLFDYDQDEDLTLGPTGYTVIEDDGGVTTDVTAALPRSLWGGVPAVGDALYFLNTGLMFNKLAIGLSVAAVGTSIRWEYRDDLRELPPDAAAAIGGGVRFRLDTVLGTTPATGATVVATCLRTGGTETLAVTWNGSWNQAEAGMLGQSAVSTTVGDYLIAAPWPELPELEDGSAGLTTDGDVTWTLPQDTARRWATDTVGSSSGYAVRARVTAISTPTAPTLDEVTEPRKTTWSLLVALRQGRQVEDKVGTTDAGTASQAFTLTRGPFLELVSLTVGGEVWTVVANFLSSASWDKHARLQEQPDGSWVVTFGNGTNGKIPASTVDVVATYRIGGDLSGNVGADTIVRDRSGNAKIKAPRNPRAAIGWVAQEGTTDASLAELRDSIPASLRALGRAVTPEDTEALALGFTTADGSQVAIRALAVEEGAGPKTILLVVVGPGGIAPTTADLDELAAYYNGTTRGLQRVGGVLLANQELTAQAFTQRAIDVTATVTILADYATGAQAAIETALGALLSPVAMRQVRDSDGVWAASSSYLWDFGGTVARAALFAGIVTASSGISNVDLTTPAADVTLAAYELPIPGTIAITLVIL